MAAVATALPKACPRASLQSRQPQAGNHALQLQQQPQRGLWARPRQGSGRCHAGGGGEPEDLSPREALLAALRETGVPESAIQLGRAEGDDETWEDLLDAETDDMWMRDPPVPEIVEELLGGDVYTAMQQERQRQEQRQRQQEQQQQDGSKDA